MANELKEIVGGKVYYKQQFHDNMILILNDNIKRIYNLLDLEELEAYEFFKKDHSSIETIDGKGDYIVPGFIDIHIHGYKGVDVMNGSIDALKSMKSNLVENGVTQFLATTMTMGKEKINAALEAVRETIKEQEDEVIGAEIIGVHLEGPFINSDYKGAQPEAYIIGVDYEILENYKDIIKIVTIAPEIKGSLDAIKTFSSYMKFSMGHSGATYTQAKEAIACGACGTTHLFNAMLGLTHREPGLVGAALTTDIYSEVIADNIHIHPDLFPFILKNKGLEKILLVTDCMQGGGLVEGVYELGGQKVIIENGKCTLTSGTIAGSVLRLHQGLQNFIKGCKETLEHILPMVTINQAKYLGIEDITGSIEEGKLGNLVIMDKNFKIKKTIVKGQVVYEN